MSNLFNWIEFFFLGRINPYDLMYHGGIAYAVILLLTFLRSYLVDKQGTRIKGTVVNATVIEDLDNHDPDAIAKRYYNECKIKYQPEGGQEQMIVLKTLTKKRIGDPVDLLIFPGGKIVKEDHPMRIYQSPITLLMVAVLSVLFFGIAFIFAGA